MECFLGNQFYYRLCLIFVVWNYSRKVTGDTKFPCYFIFGDSLLDAGNNNALKTGAKANYLPYGIDFPQGPTGRFSNGLNAADFVAKDLGFKDFIPPYATVKIQDVLKGVNYASAGSGILDESGENVGERFSFNMQIKNHIKMISLIKTRQGNESYTKAYLKKCLYTVQIGNNDYINNYFAPNSVNKRQNVSPDQFATTLVNQFSQQLNWLYKLGARKLCISGSGQIGCVPAEKRLFGTRIGCVKEINDALIIFNAKILSLLVDLNINLEDAKIVYHDINNPTSGVPQFDGILQVNSCCKVSTKGVTRGQCLPTNVTCLHRNNYWFFDEFHPTDLQLFPCYDNAQKMAHILIAAKLDSNYQTTMTQDGTYFQLRPEMPLVSNIKITISAKSDRTNFCDRYANLIQKERKILLVAYQQRSLNLLKEHK